MKKIIYLFVALSLLVSCSNDNDTIDTVAFNNKNLKSYSWNNITSTTNLMSKFFYQMGVTKILVDSQDGSDKINYSFEVSKQTVIDDEVVDFSTKKFVLENNIIYEITSPDYLLKYNNSQLYIKTPNTGDFILLDGKYTSAEREVLKLLIFFNELTLTNDGKFSPIVYDQEIMAETPACDPSKIRYMTGGGSTQAAAEASLSYYEQNGQSVMGTYINSFSCRKLSSSPTIRDFLGLGVFISATSTWCCGGNGAGGSW